MPEKQLIKNIEFSQALDLENLVEYQDGQVSSRTFAQNNAMSLTLFAFAEGEGLSTHSASGDAFVQVLDGQATLTIGGEEVTAKRGEVVVMPANVPHSVDAKETLQDAPDRREGRGLIHPAFRAIAKRYDGFLPERSRRALSSARNRLLRAGRTNSLARHERVQRLDEALQVGWLAPRQWLPQKTPYFCQSAPLRCASLS